MKRKTYKVVSSVEGFAEKLHGLLDGGELYFAVEWDEDSHGDVDAQSVDESFTCWYGAKVIDCFDAACLLVGRVSGEEWLAYNVTTPMRHESLILIAKAIFDELEITGVCLMNGDV